MLFLAPLFRRGVGVRSRLLRRLLLDSRRGERLAIPQIRIGVDRRAGGGVDAVVEVGRRDRGVAGVADVPMISPASTQSPTACGP